MRRDLRIIFAGGGTGGHVFPAIYMATFLKKHWGADCQFIGTKKGIENSKVSQAGFLVRHIWISGFRRGLYFGNLLFPLKLVVSAIQSRRLLRQIKPHLVIGTGGYVAGPVVRQAVKMNVPTAIQEQNSFPGVTTRLLAPHVDVVFLAYEESLKYFKNLKNYKLVGNPIKENLLTNRINEARKYFGLRKGLNTILIFGGSQGSKNINRAVDKILSEKLLKDQQIIWQTGQLDFEHYTVKYKNYKHLNICITPFIDRMDYAYSVSNLAISRSGAMTISELSAAGLPAILIPYPFAAANHQYKNAQTIVENGGAVLVEDNPDLVNNLSTNLLSLLSTPERINEMAATIRRFHKTDTMIKITKELTRLIDTTQDGSGTKQNH